MDLVCKTYTFHLGHKSSITQFTATQSCTNGTTPLVWEQGTRKIQTRALPNSNMMSRIMRKPLIKSLLEPDRQWKLNSGKFGGFGGNDVPEIPINFLNQLESEFNRVLQDTTFQNELSKAFRDYVGRETPLYFAEKLTDHYKNDKREGPQIYLKREDLNNNYLGAHKISNAIAQAMIAKRMGRKSVVAAIGAGQHGVATASACRKLDLDCTVFIGTADMDRQSSEVNKMKLVRAQVKEVDGTFKEASSEAIKYLVENLGTSYLLTGTVAAGPHPYPIMVREFQSIIGKEIKEQAMEKWGGQPDVLIASMGSGSNALCLFHEFRKDKDVRLIGVKGTMSCFLLQDDEEVGLDKKRVDLYTVTDKEAMEAYCLLCKLEGIFPSLEASHALAYLEKLCPTLPNDAKVVVSCSGNGDKDDETLLTVISYKYHN